MQLHMYDTTEEGWDKGQCRTEFGELISGLSLSRSSGTFGGCGPLAEKGDSGYAGPSKFIGGIGTDAVVSRVVGRQATSGDVLQSVRLMSDSRYISALHQLPVPTLQTAVNIQQVSYAVIAAVDPSRRRNVVRRNREPLKVFLLLFWAGCQTGVPGETP